MCGRDSISTLLVLGINPGPALARCVEREGCRQYTYIYEYTHQRGTSLAGTAAAQAADEAPPCLPPATFTTVLLFRLLGVVACREAQLTTACTDSHL